MRCEVGERESIQGVALLGRLEDEGCSESEDGEERRDDDGLGAGRRRRGLRARSAGGGGRGRRLAGSSSGRRGSSSSTGRGRGGTGSRRGGSSSDNGRRLGARGRGSSGDDGGSRVAEHRGKVSTVVRQNSMQEKSSRKGSKEDQSRQLSPDHNHNTAPARLRPADRGEKLTPRCP